jgi:ATP-dependent DNA helicase RecQ
MTRAKQHLTIHLNTGFLDNISIENLSRESQVSQAPQMTQISQLSQVSQASQISRISRIVDKNPYPPPNEVVMHLTHRDIWLSYFTQRQYPISQLTSGDILTLNVDECLTPSGQSVLKFSRTFVAQIETMKTKGYELKHAKVNFILWWLNEEAGKEVKIILPEVCFEKN